MKTLQKLIDQLGPPPAEVCLDWAWQLQQFKHSVANSKIRLHGPARREWDDDKASHTIWSAVGVEDDGQLRWLAHVDEFATAADAAIEAMIVQLLDWTHQQSDIPLADPSQFASVFSKLEQTTLAFGLQADQVAPASSAAQEKNPVRATTSSRASHCEVSPLIVQRNLSTRWRLKFDKKHFLTLWGLPVLMTFAAVCSFFWGRERSLESLAATSAMNHETSFASVAAEPAMASTTSKANGSSLAKMDRPRSSVDSASSSTELPSLADQGRLAAMFEAVSLSAADGVAARNAEVVDYVTPNRSDEASRLGAHLALPSGHANFASESLVAADTGHAAGIDVLAELASLTKSAELELSETQINSKTSELQDASEEPPWTVATFPVFQLQKFAKTLKPQTPAWELRLAVREGLTIEPVGPQLISARETATWIIQQAPRTDQPAGLRDVATRIVVQAQLANKRDTSLRWRLVAGAQDLPLIAVPMGQKYLDALQTYLKSQTQWMQFEMNRLRYVARAEGMPEATRSAMSARARMFDSQLNMAARLLEIVADVNQLDGWLDSQLEVHAKLLDSATHPPRILLKYGDAW